MSVTIPYMNPIRFYKISDAPDFSSRWPNVYNIKQRVEYMSNIKPVKYFKEFLINQEVTLQFRIDSVDDTRIRVTNPDGTISLLTGININPDGWTGLDVYKYSFTPTIEGKYEMQFNDVPYKSDEFYVHNIDKFKRQLVFIEYENSTNDYDMVFYNNDENVYRGKIYFTGVWNPVSKNEISAFVSDRGRTEKLRSTPVMGIELVITDLHWSYYPAVLAIFSCDTIKVNGINYQNEETFEPEIIPNGDVFNARIILFETDNTYSIKEI